MNKFLNVDVIDTLSDISDQITLGTCGLSRGNIDEIYQMVKMQPENPLNMLWACEPAESNIFDERDAYMQDTTINRMLEYCLDQNFPWRVKLYGIEITCTEDECVLGNIYEYDPQQYARFAKQNAQPYSDLTLTFADGKKLCVPKDAIIGEKWDQLESEHGNIVWVRRETTNEAAMQSALCHERTLCNAVPARDFPAYLQRLGEQQIQAIANSMVSRLQHTDVPNYPHPSVKAYVVAVPHEFWRAGNQKLHQLTLKLREIVGDPNLYIGQFRNMNGLFAITDKPERKPSIKECLAATPLHSDKTVVKAKNRKER